MKKCCRHENSETQILILLCYLKLLGTINGLYQKKATISNAYVVFVTSFDILLKSYVETLYPLSSTVFYIY